MGKTQASIEQYCRQEAQTASLAKNFATSISQLLSKEPQTHLNISLEGDLGSGKTSFARYLIQSLGHAGKVKSPTYTLCEPYPLQIGKAVLTAHHFDLYRMKDPLEWQEAGFEEYFDVPGFCLIEWPEKAEGTLPAFDIRICLSAGADENERKIHIQAISELGQSVLNAMNAITK
jgi:tRNA threonylcarbamoyladenosine biosynthesis protein TsaE